MKKYVTDTIALLAYITDALPTKADNIFKKAEENKALLVVPSICIGEFIYTILKQKPVFKKIPSLETIELLLDIIEHSESIKYSSLTLTSWKIVPTINIPELHDRIVVATYLQENAEAILTNDPEIAKTAETIWD
ncbi:MAG: type II toxin-antitoxin system VapC family toxin [Candidatus Baldrarchaeia archaeon]